MINSDSMLPILVTQRISLEKEAASTETERKTAPNFIAPAGNNSSYSQYSSDQQSFDEVQYQDNFSGEPNIITSFSGKIKVSFLLKSRESLELYLNSSSDPIFNNIRFFFIVLRNTQKGLMSQIENSFRAGSGRGFLDILNLQYEEVTLSQVLENNTATEETQTNLNSDYIHDFHQQVTIPYDHDDVQSLHLMSFAYLDLEDLGEEQLEFSVLESINYDHLLESGTDGGLGIPLFRNVFYVNDPQNLDAALEPYFGSTHYHSESNPGPDGYIGWMAGHSHEMGPKLEVRKIRNYKVVSSGFGFASKSQAFSLEFLKGTSDHSTGTGLDNFLNSTMTLESAMATTLRTVQKANASADALGKSSPLNFIERGTELTPTIELFLENMEDSSYKSVIGIDFLNIIKYQSLFGDIVTFQQENGNLEFVNSCLYYSEIANIKIKRRRLVEDPHHYNDLDSKVYTKFNKNTKDKTIVHSSDAIPDLERQAADGSVILQNISTNEIKGRLFPTRSPWGHIEEIEMMVPAFNPTVGTMEFGRSSPYIRHFVIKDYDLFHNIDFGEYTYVVELVLRDGTPIVIDNIMKNLNFSIENLNDYLERSRELITKDSEGRIISGNFNPDTFQVSREFSNDEKNQAIINSSIQAYSRAVSFLSGKALTEQQIVQISNILSPAAFDYQTVEKFRDEISAIRGSLFQILKTHSSLLDKERAEHSEKIFPGNSKDSGIGFIKTESKTRILLKAFTPSTVVADYGLNLPDPSFVTAPFQQFASKIRTFGNRMQKQMLMPNSFLTITGQKYETKRDDWIVQEKATAAGWAKGAQQQKATAAGWAKGTMRTGQGIPTADVKKAINENITTKNKGQTNVLFSKLDYDLKGASFRSSAKIKFQALKVFDSSNTGVAKKSEVFFPEALQDSLGVEYRLQGLGYQTDIFQTLIQKDELLESDTEVSQTLVDSICAAALKGEDKTAYIENNFDRFRAIVDTKNKFGFLYEQVNKMLFLAQDNFYGKSEIKIESDYLGESFNTNTEGFNLKPQNPFVQAATHTVFHTPGTAPVAVELGALKMETPTAAPLGGMKRCAMVRLETAGYTNDADFTPANNSVMLEI